jgi:hypothetical protein
MAGHRDRVTQTDHAANMDLDGLDYCVEDDYKSNVGGYFDERNDIQDL